jgi:hypothetical protein
MKAGKVIVTTTIHAIAAMGGDVTAQLLREKVVARDGIIHFTYGPVEFDISIAPKFVVSDMRAQPVLSVRTRRQLGRKTNINFPLTANITMQGGRTPPPGFAPGTFEASAFDMPDDEEDVLDMLRMMSLLARVPNIGSNGRPNYVWVNFTSLVAPTITLKGEIERIEHGFTQMDANNIRWTFTMNVFEMLPKLTRDGLNKSLADADKAKAIYVITSKDPKPISTRPVQDAIKSLDSLGS